MARGATPGPAEEAEEFERFMVLASRLNPDQLQVLTALIEAACAFEANGDEAGLEQLLSNGPALLRRS